MLVIGIEGLAGHGKDTVAKMISKMANLDNYVNEIHHFATPIKHIAEYMFDMADADMNTFEGKLKPCPRGYGMTNREVIQKLGTECFRSIFSPNIWIDFLDRKITDKKELALALIPDVRFPNEADYVDNIGFRIKVSDPRKGGLEVGGNHESEKGTGKDPLFHIINDGSLLDLEKEVYNIYSTHISGLLHLKF